MTDGKKQTKGFHLIESYEVLENSQNSKRMVKVEVTLSDWFYNSLVGKEVLTINRDYFRLRKSLERWLYELARKHCGKQTEWSPHFETLHEKTGSQSPLKNFRFQIRKIIKNDEEHNHFPDYQMQLSKDDYLIFTQKNRTAKNNKGQGVLALDDLPMIDKATIDKGRRIVQESDTG